MSSFTIAILALSSSCLAAGPRAIPRGTAANFAILATTRISTIPASLITGDIGIGPSSSSALVGFALTTSSSAIYATSPQIIGKAYAADYASPTPSMLTTATSDVKAAYNDATGRANPRFTNFGDGDIGGLTLLPGLYKWTTAVSIARSVTISGSAADTWIFQVAKALSIAEAQAVVLKGGASIDNIVWVVAGPVALAKYSVFKGTILGAQSITLRTGASIDGRLLSQTAVTLTKATVTVGGGVSVNIQAAT